MFNRSRWLIVFASILLVPSMGATQSSKRLSPQQQLEQKVQLLERKLQAMNSRVVQLDALQREVQQLRGELEVQSFAMDALKKRQRDLYLDVDQRLNQLSHGSMATSPNAAATQTPDVSVESPAGQAEPVQGAAPVETASPTSPPVPAVAASSTAVSTPPSAALVAPAVVQDPVAEEAAYKQAFELLMQRRYGDARSAFQLFLTQYSAGKFADNAQYWLAEASYVTRDFDRALGDFQTVISQYPSSTKVPDALLKTSFIQYEKKQWAEARATLEGLIKNHPSTTASRLAGDRLKRMQSEGH